MKVETVYTGVLFGITQNDERVDMRMNLQDHNLDSLMCQAEKCADILKSPSYKSFEIELNTKIPVRCVKVKEAT